MGPRRTPTRTRIACYVKGEKVLVFSNSLKEWTEATVTEVAPPDKVFVKGSFKVLSRAGTKWVGAEKAKTILKKQVDSTVGTEVGKEAKEADKSVKKRKSDK